MADSELTVHESRLEFNRGRKLLRWAALIYTLDFFIKPLDRHSWAVWIEFAVFYALFLALYFLTTTVTGRKQQIVLGLFFLLGFLYYPFDHGSVGVFVYAFVMSAFYVRHLRNLFLVLALEMTGLVLEIWILGGKMEVAESVLLFSVVIGLSNFAYAQQTRANMRLEKANAEIEHLTQEAERERIARDLHDLLGHTLTVIAVKLDLARRLLPRDVERAQSEIVEAEQTARKALAEVREAVVGYRSEGLSTEIARARQALFSANVQLAASIAPVELSVSQGNVLCLALREAVTNIVRHAQASQCRLELLLSETGLSFTIEDDGVGGSLCEGSGLRGMRERVRAIGGSLELLSTDPRGTRLVLEVPLVVGEGLRMSQCREAERV